MNNVDKEYFRLINTVLTNGRRKKNRTGVDTIGVFGEQAKFDINLDAFPILTTKKVFFKGILHELLWFIKGDTNIKYLVDNNVHIWDEWAFKRYSDWYNKIRGDTTDFTINWNDPEPVQYTQDEFIQKIKDDAEFAKKWGELGQGTYGGMWRAFPYCEAEKPGEPSEVPMWEEYVDQLKKVVDKLKSNPDDRRMIVSAWHPYWIDHCALPPCHCLFHFNTEELTILERVQYAAAHNIAIQTVGPVLDASNDTYNTITLDNANVPRRRLNCLLYQRSLDLPLGGPFNITSYCLLTAMVAHCVNMVPGVFTWSTGDTHIYVNQIEGIQEQLKREPKSLPKLWINPNVKDLFSFTFDDIRLEGYDPHPTIKMPVAV
jgi:thymidylate synthase